MNISENIQWIMGSTAQWSLVRNKSYQAQIQKANPEKIYNVEGQKGVVYNFLEDAYEKVNPEGYVITGAASEMWPIGAGALKKYQIAPEDITEVPQLVNTVELDTVYAAIQIPVDTKFTLEVDYGEKAVLKGNRPELEHGSGDYVLIATKSINGQYVPDFEDSGRIVNGAIFSVLYQPILLNKR